MSNVTYSAGNLTITVAGLDTVEQALGDLKRKTPAAAKVAINATARQARKLMVAKAKTRYAVNAAGRRHLKDLVQRKKASNSSLLAELHVASMRNDLGYFKTSPAVPTHFTSTGWVQGPSVWKGKVLKANGMRELPGRGNRSKAFLVKKNKSASRAPAGESIEQRPEEIDEREEFGHWEGDTVYSGKGKRKTTRALLTLTERKTRKEIIIAIPNRKAETVVKALDALERKLGARRFRAIFKSITFDNGTEFAAAEELERSCVNKRLPRTKVYFCHPYSSWERGTNENTNGMIRRRFPKGTNFAAVTNAQIAQAENWINNYPRKILGYKSSEIVFRECLRELGIAA